MNENSVLHENSTLVGEDAAVAREPVATRRPRWRGWAGRVLPEAPPSPWPRGRLAVGYVVAFLAATAFQLLIPAGRSRWTHVWAEDGGIFLFDGVHYEFLTAITLPYGGYLHTVPRLIAEPVVTLLPPELVAPVFAVASAAVRSLIALLVYAASRAYLRSSPVRFAHAALVVVLPVGLSEPLDNLTNLHWFLLYGVFWALLWRSAPRVPVAVFAVLAALTSPMVFLLVPIALVRLLLPRARSVAAAFLAASALQAVAMSRTERLPYSQDHYEPMQVVLAALLRVPLAGFTGSEQVYHYYPAYGHLPLLVALLLAGLPILAALRWGTLAVRLVVLASLGLGAVVITASLTTNWINVLAVSWPGVVLVSQRYSVIPCLFMFSAVALGLDLVPRRPWGRTVRRGWQVVIALVLVAGVVQHTRTGAGVLTGVTWEQAIADARAQCAAGQPSGRLVHEPPGWAAEVPCDYLTR